MDKDNEKKIEIQNKTKEIIAMSRFYAARGLAFNINRMGFLPKIGDSFNYKSINKMRVMSHVLSNSFKTGDYYESRFLKDNGLEIKENEHPVLLESWKVVNEEFGYKDAYTISKYNIDQLTDDSKEKLFKILEEKENKKNDFEFIEKKYNVSKKELDQYIEDKNMDKLDKILFLGIVRAKTGGYIFFPKLDNTEKQNLIYEVERNPDYLKEYIFRADENSREYLKDRVLNKEEIEANKEKYEEIKKKGEIKFYDNQDKERDEI